LADQARPVNAGGVQALLLTPATDVPLGLLYLHGGGYVLGSAYGYRSLAGALAVAAKTDTLVADYRLAPEHPFPAALEDALRTYLWILDRGTLPEQLALAGDSSGGGLAMSLLLSLKQQELPLPGCVVLLSPGVDHGRTALGPPPGEDALLDVSMEQVRRFTGFYLGAHPADDPLVNPLTADLTGLPPMLIQVGTGDPFRNQSHRLADASAPTASTSGWSCTRPPLTSSTCSGRSSRKPPTRSSRPASSSARRSRTRR
jgi:epsilon-lactone hydrolase